MFLFPAHQAWTLNQAWKKARTLSVEIFENCRNEDNLKREEDLKDGDKLKNEDNLKIEDNLKYEDNLKN